MEGFGQQKPGGFGGFGQQQQQSPFGQPQTSKPASGFSFGAATQPAQQTGGLFGAQTATSQASTGGLFGSTTATSQPASTSLFGSTTATSQPSTGLFGATATSQPASTGLFGATSQPATSGGLFGASKPATGGLFGATTTAASTAPSTGLFGATVATSQPGGMFGANMTAGGGSLFGQQQPTQSLFGQPVPQQQQIQTVSTALDDVERIYAAYNTQDQRCRFRHPFYNLVAPEDAPKYGKPANVPDGLWNEAVRASPDVKCMVPVFAAGFADLEKRVQYQVKETNGHKEKLKAIQEELDALETKEQVEILSRLQRCQREHSKVSEKVVKILKLVQLLRSKGHPVAAEEEEFRSRLEKLSALLNKPEFKAKLQELDAQKKILEMSQRTPSYRSVGASLSVNQETMDSVSAVLAEMQAGLKQVTDLLQEDMKELSAIDSGLMERENRENLRWIPTTQM